MCSREAFFFFSLLNNLPSLGDGKTVFGVDLSETVIKRGVRTTWSHGYIPMFMKNLIEFLSREGNLGRGRGGVIWSNPDNPIHTKTKNKTKKNHSGLNTEGIFRVPGNARKIENMREHCDKTGGPIDLVGEKVHVRRRKKQINICLLVFPSRMLLVSWNDTFMICRTLCLRPICTRTMLP